jgi:hypothetical protein
MIGEKERRTRDVHAANCWVVTIWHKLMLLLFRFYASFVSQRPTEICHSTIACCARETASRYDYLPSSQNDLFVLTGRISNLWDCCSFGYVACLAVE